MVDGDGNLSAVLRRGATPAAHRVRAQVAAYLWGVWGVIGLAQGMRELLTVAEHSHG